MKINYKYESFSLIYKKLVKKNINEKNIFRNEELFVSIIHTKTGITTNHHHIYSLINKKPINFSEKIEERRDIFFIIKFE